MSQPDTTTTNSNSHNVADMTAEEQALLDEAAAADKPLEEGTAAADKLAAEQAAAAGASPPPAAEAPAPAPEAAAATAAPAASTEAAVVAADQPAAAAAVPSPTPPPANALPLPQYRGTDRDFATELSAIDQEKLTLKAQYKKGDIDDDKYEDEFDAINERRNAVLIAQSEDRLRADLAQQNADHSWATLQRQWLQVPANAAIANSPLMFRAWESAMQIVVDRAAAEGKTLQDWAIFEGARGELVAEGLLQVAAAAPAATAAPAAGEKPAPRAAPFAEVPTTLSVAPQGADAGSGLTADNLFGADIEDLEERMSRMPEDQRDRLLKQVPGHLAADS